MNQKNMHALRNVNRFLIQMLTLSSDEAFSTQNVDRQALMHLAKLHGILPQLYKTSQNTLTLFSQEEQKRLTDEYREIMKANLLLTIHLSTLSKNLEEYHFPYIAIKGPTLAQTLYGDISMRQFSDIDLLVEEEKLYEISELILSLEYTPVLPLTLLKRKKFLALDNDFSFRHNKTGALLELHWKLFPVRHKMPLDFTLLYRDAQPVMLQNREINALSAEHNLLYLSLHGAKHIFERYEWVYDLHMLISKTPQMDLEQIYLQAKSEQIETPFLLGLFLSQTLFGTVLPGTLQQHKSEQVQSLIDKTLAYYEQGFVYWDESDKKRARFLFLAELFPAKTSRTAWLFKSFFKTTPVDVITFNLPDSIDFLYPLLRPFRLFYKHLFTKKPQYAEV